MTYRSGRSKKTGKYINIGLGFVVFMLFIYFWGEFRSIVYPIVEPLVRGYGGTKSGIKIVPEYVSSYFSSRNTLIQENQNLELNVERLENAIAEKDATIREMSVEKNILNTDMSAPVLIMYPVASDITNLYSTLLLSKGFKDGVEKGEMVYVRGMQPVCEVIEVYDHTSLCELLTKSGRETEGVTASSSITLTLVGNGGGSFIAEVPKGTDVSVGEAVYLRSNPAYTLGTVVSAQDDKQATGVQLYIRGAYNPVASSVFYLHTSYAP